MVGAFQGWQRRILHDGCVFTPPRGPSAGKLRIIDRVAPLRTVAEIVDAGLAEMAPRVHGLALARLETVTTMEGEYGALATIGGTAEGQPIERLMGFVFGDDFYAKVDALFDASAAEAEAFRANTRTIMQNFPLGLGTMRKRRFLYTPPPKWQGRGRPVMIVDWFPTDFPRRHMIITVCPAKPVTRQIITVGIDRMLHEDILASFVQDGQVTSERIFTTHGLAGDLVHIAGHHVATAERHLHIDTAVLVDGRYVYVLRLECDDANLKDARATFLQMVRTAGPLPISQADDLASQSAVFWAN